MHAGTYMITYNDGLKTDKWSALTLLGGSFKSDRLLRRFESTGNKWIDTGISFIADFNVDESVRIECHHQLIQFYCMILIIRQ